MFVLRRANPGGLQLEYIIFQHMKFQKVYEHLKSMNEDKFSGGSTNPGDNYLIFKSDKNKPEKLIQVFIVTARQNGFKLLQNLLPHDFWWTKKMKRESEMRREDDYGQSRPKVFRDPGREDFHSDG